MSVVDKSSLPVGRSQSAPRSPTHSFACVSDGNLKPSDGPGSLAPVRRTQSLCPGGTDHVLGIPFRDVREQYSLCEVLGEGISGMVRSCVNRRTGEFFACKSILKSSLTTPYDVTCLQNEVKTMLMVGQHPAVVSLRDVFEDSEEVHLIMDLCKGGDLFDRIMERKQYTEREAARVCRILISVLQHCNANGIMHRDFKPENILLTSESNTAIKVADFGRAVFYQPGVNLTYRVGTVLYMAPEVLARSYGAEADVWSIGVILYILLSGRPPFWAPDVDGVLAKVKRGEYDVSTGIWRHISPGAKDLVVRMLCMDPAKRITSEEIKGHPWIVHHCTLQPHMGGPVSVPGNPMPQASPVPEAKRVCSAIGPTSFAVDKTHSHLAAAAPAPAPAYSKPTTPPAAAPVSLPSPFSSSCIPPAAGAPPLPLPPPLPPANHGGRKDGTCILSEGSKTRPAQGRHGLSKTPSAGCQGTADWIPGPPMVAFRDQFCNMAT